jgi:gas vesicle protein
MSHRSNESSLVPFMFGILLGVLNGVLLGILLAPRSGDESRQYFLNRLLGLKPDEQSFLNKTRINLENQMDRMNRAIKALKMAKAKRREEMATGFEFN